MKQSFTVGKLTLLQDDLGYSIAQDTKDGEAEVVASFKHVLDALDYFTKYCFTMAELEVQETININNIPDDKEEHNGKK